MACFVVVLGAGAASKTAAPLRYNRDIRPILSDNCFRCHGADKNARKAKLRLDDRDVAVEKEAIVPGKAGDSELVKRIYATNADDLMPPAESNKKLTAEQKQILQRWINEGAAYEPHWAFIPPARPKVPTLKSAGPEPKNPIDAFILSELEARNVRPSPPADGSTLLRRVSLDLTGLPPTRADAVSFDSDSASNAYERLVDRLLASPHYGERMAVPWLDVVRFADTVGYHGDQNVNVFPYRDYVIKAFNRNKPFDQFTIEQLAGDLLPHSTMEQRVATGFNRLNMVTREGGAQPKEHLAKYGADRVRTVGMAWLGLTVGCAECHDHKFDPFTTKDFYQLKAFFADVRQWGVYSDYKYTPNPDLKGWDNDHPFPPEEVVESAYLRSRMGKLRGEIDEIARAAAEKDQLKFITWSNTISSFLGRMPDGWQPVTPVPTVYTNSTITTNKLKATNVIALADNAGFQTNITRTIVLKTNLTAGTNFVIEADGALVFPAKADGRPLRFKLDSGYLAAVRVELLPREESKGSVFRGGKPSETILLSAAISRGDSRKESKLAFHYADATVKESRYSNGYEILGIKDGWKLSREDARQKLAGVWLLDPPMEAKAGDTLVLSLKTNNIASMRVTVSPLAGEKPLEPPVGANGCRPATWLASTAADADAFARYKGLHRSILECRDGKSPTVVTIAWQPETTRVLPRGNWQSEDGAIVQPFAPHFLPQKAPAGTNRLTRLDLAKWLVSPENPLTARAVVNRLWKQFFGSGIANPVDDLGVQGEPPSHPELLDWLAVEFRESGWDVKHIVRLIVTSSTYRQSSNLRAELREIDPNNRLLASQNPRRLEAEFVRDNALTIAGLLNEEIGGPSSHPYQPAGYYGNLQFPDRDYYADKDDRQYRRGIYAHWQRTFLQPMLANFDAPSREECVAIRTVSNTPQQALTLLNDPTFVEAARVWATKLIAAAPDDDNRLEVAYQSALARSIKPNERASLKTFLAAQRSHLQTDADEPAKLMKIGNAPAPADINAELGAWTSVCRVILNLHETITIY